MGLSPHWSVLARPRPCIDPLCGGRRGAVRVAWVLICFVPFFSRYCLLSTEKQQNVLTFRCTPRRPSYLSTLWRKSADLCNERTPDVGVTSLPVCQCNGNPPSLCEVVASITTVIFHCWQHFDVYMQFNVTFWLSLRLITASYPRPHHYSSQ